MKHLFKLLNRLFLLSFLLVVGEGKAQDIYLDKDYGWNWKTHRADIGTNSALTTETTHYPAAYAFVKSQGWSDAQFLKLSDLSAGGLDAVHKTDASGTNNPTCQSRAVIHVPFGKFNVDYPLQVCFGQWLGAGTSAFYSTNTIAQGSTHLWRDEAGWLGNPAEQNVFQSNTWGREDLYSYNESFLIDGFRIDGMKTSETWNSAVNSSGIAIWDAGSTSKIGRVFIENFNTAGIHAVRGTPMHVDVATIFRCNLAGVWLQGGGMHHFGVMEFDENPTCFYVSKGHGRDGGTTLQVDYLKAETGIAPGRPTAKAQMVLDCEEGWTVANFSMISWASVGYIPECLFRVNATSNVSSVSANLRLWGACRSLVHGVKEGKKWTFECAGQNLNGCWGSAIHHFDYTSANGGQLTTAAGTPGLITGVAKNRLAAAQTDPNTGTPITVYNDAAGTPAYPFGATGGTTTPPPIGTPCTSWTTGPWSTCTNGVQTRTVSPSPAGCNTTPPGTKPAESQTCTVTPPPSGSWTTLWTGTTVSSTTCKDGFSVTATKVRLTNWTPSALNYGRIVGTGSNKNSLQLWPDGYLYFGNTKCVTDLPGKIAAGTKYASVTVTIPTSVLTTAWQTNCGHGGACPGTCEKLEAQ